MDVDAADGCKLLDYFVHIMTTTLHASSWLYESRAVQANLCPAYVCVARFISGTETVTENLVLILSCQPVWCVVSGHVEKVHCVSWPRIVRSNSALKIYVFSVLCGPYRYWLIYISRMVFYFCRSQSSKVIWLKRLPPKWRKLCRTGHG